VEQLQQVDVARVLTEVLLEEVVDGTLQHESIVDGNEPNTLYTVPAWLTATGNGRVHEIIRNEEEGLELSRLNLSMRSPTIRMRPHKLDTPA
jgi:hypothetical protein